MRLVLLPLPLLLTGCVSLGGLPASSPGTGPLASGGGVGVAGSGVAAPVISSLAKGDRERALAAEYQALEFQPVGDPVEWQGVRAAGAARALAPFRVGSQNCRQLVHTINLGAEQRTERGSACREPNGTWTPLS